MDSRKRALQGKIIILWVMALLRRDVFQDTAILNFFFKKRRKMFSNATEVDNSLLFGKCPISKFYEVMAWPI